MLGTKPQKTKPQNELKRHRSTSSSTAYYRALIVGRRDEDDTQREQLAGDYESSSKLAGVAIERDSERAGGSDGTEHGLPVPRSM